VRPLRATFLPQGIDANPATRQRITISLTAFQPFGSSLLSQFKAIWFRQGAAGVNWCLRRRGGRLHVPSELGERSAGMTRNGPAARPSDP
jgi:hypothetical protein